MELAFGNDSTEINLNQPFLETTEESLLFKIIRFSVFRMTEQNLLPSQVEYFVILDLETGSKEMFALGIAWILQGKLLKVKTRTKISQGSDREQVSYIVDAIVEKLTKEKIIELKRNSVTPKEIQTNSLTIKP